MITNFKIFENNNQHKYILARLLRNVIGDKVNKYYILKFKPINNWNPSTNFNYYNICYPNFNSILFKVYKDDISENGYQDEFNRLWIFIDESKDYEKILYQYNIHIKTSKYNL